MNSFALDWFMLYNVTKHDLSGSLHCVFRLVFPSYLRADNNYELTQRFKHSRWTKEISFNNTIYTEITYHIETHKKVFRKSTSADSICFFWENPYKMLYIQYHPNRKFTYTFTHQAQVQVRYPGFMDRQYLNLYHEDIQDLLDRAHKYDYMEENKMLHF